MQNHLKGRYLLILALGSIALFILLYYFRPSRPIPLPVHEEFSTNYSEFSYITPSNALAKNALIQQAVGDAEKVARIIGMSVQDINQVKQNAKIMSKKYLHSYLR